MTPVRIKKGLQEALLFKSFNQVFVFSGIWIKRSQGRQLVLVQVFTV
jgi:hypothetical protein